VPVAADDGAATDEGTPTTIAGAGQRHRCEWNPAVRALDRSDGTKGGVTLRGDGTITYDPRGRFKALSAGEVATDSFTYRASDGMAESAPATVTVTVVGGP